MAKKVNISLIKTRKLYSTQELADLLKVHVRTIQAWRIEGMDPLEKNARPYRYLGFEVKEFLHKKQKKYRLKLELHQFYCLKCRKRTESVPQEFKFEITEKGLGNGDKHARLTGKCFICGTDVYKFSSDKVIKKMISLNLLREGRKGLNSNSAPALNTDIDMASKKHISEQLCLNF